MKNITVFSFKSILPPPPIFLIKIRKTKLLAIGFFCISILFSCQKYIEGPTELVKESSVEDFQKPWRAPNISTRSGGYGYIDQAHLDEVNFADSLMHFDSYEHLEEYVEYLDSLVDVHNDAFDALYGDLDEDATEAKEIELNFHTDQPLLDFEDYFQFPSLRKKIEAEVNVWLNNAELDFNNSPENHPIVDEATRTLVKEDGLIKINGVVTNLKSMGICEALGNECCTVGTRALGYTYVFDGRNRKMWLLITLRNALVNSKIKGKTISYKEITSEGGGWKHDKTRIVVGIEGRYLDNSCDNDGTVHEYKDKKRYHLAVRQNSWGYLMRGQNFDFWVRGRYPDRGNEINILPIFFY